jgi:hypothetical protein
MSFVAHVNPLAVQNRGKNLLDFGKNSIIIGGFRVEVLHFFLSEAYQDVDVAPSSMFSPDRGSEDRQAIEPKSVEEGRSVSGKNAKDPPRHLLGSVGRNNFLVDHA